MHRRRTALILSAPLLASLLAADVAAARGTRVSVLSVRGPGSRPVRRMLELAVEQRWQARSRRHLVRAARRLGVSARRWSKPANLRRMARRAGVDAVVFATVFKRSGRWWVALRVHDGATGRITQEGIASYRGFALRRRARRRLVQILRDGVLEVDGVPRTTPGRRAYPKKVPGRRGRRQRRPEPLDAAPDSGLPERWQPALVGGLGAAVWGRRLMLSGMDGAQGSQVLYESLTPLYPVAFDMEVFPGAFVTRRKALANLGVGLSYQQAVGVRTVREGDPAPVDTTVLHLGVMALYRWNIRGRPTSPDLVFGLGVDVRRYSFSESLGPVAGVRYVSIRPEVRARFPLGTPRIRLQVRLAGLAPLTMGQIENPYHYGDGSAGGLDAALELDVDLFWRVHLRLGATTSWMFIRFPQKGTQGLDYQYAATWAKDGTYGAYLLGGFEY